MKRKTVLGTVLLVLLLLQAQTVFAGSVIRVACLANPNRNNNILGEVSIGGSFYSLVGYEYSSGSEWFRDLKNGPYLVTVKSYKWSRGDWREAYSETLRVETYNNYTNITCSFDNNGKILNLRIVEQQDLIDEFILDFMEKRDATGLTSFFQKKNLNLDEYINKRLSSNNTHLINEIKKTSVNLGNVQFLVENGARVNLRNDLGETAASIAYDKGEIEIYNYLKKNGAVDFEPRQVVQQPAAPTAPSGGGYTPAPPAPAQSPAPSGPSPAQQIVEALRSPLDSGTYSLAGTQAKISITAIAKSGMVTYTNRQGRTSMGNYQIDGNRMTMQLEGYTFVYTITSQTSFSGNGENWVRTGF